MIKDIDKQIAAWHENNEPAKIIELLESLPQPALTRERIGWLARAYNNLAGEEDKPEYYETAIRVLESVRDEESEKDELWNHRMGFALYHLDREGEAAEYFLRTLDGNPYDSLRDATKALLDRVCRARSRVASSRRRRRTRRRNSALGFLELANSFPRSFVRDRHKKLSHHPFGRWHVDALLAFPLFPEPHARIGACALEILHRSQRQPRSRHQFRRRTRPGRRGEGGPHRG